jgi:polyisoprenoid-binding protein YceI
MTDTVALLETSMPKPLSAVSRGRYLLDPVHTRVLFSVSHFGISTYYGEFSNPSGMLDLASPQAGAGAGAGALTVAVPVAGVLTSSRVLDEELRSGDWLDAERFPTVTFTSTSPVSLASRSFQVAGNLSLHGVTRKITLDATFVGAGINPVKQVYTIGFDIRGKLRRGDYGVMAALPQIGEEVGLIIGAAFELEAP